MTEAEESIWSEKHPEVAVWEGKVLPCLLTGWSILWLLHPDK